MAPGIRELVSIPAGILKMNLLKYLIYTYSGSFIWALFLMMIGYFFGQAPIPTIQKYSNLIFIVIALMLFSYFIFKNLLENEKK